MDIKDLESQADSANKGREEAIKQLRKLQVCSPKNTAFPTAVSCTATIQKLGDICELDAHYK